jgi:hypothetical protein
MIQPHLLNRLMTTRYYLIGLCTTMANMTMQRAAYELIQSFQHTGGESSQLQDQDNMKRLVE